MPLFHGVYLKSIFLALFFFLNSYLVFGKDMETVHKVLFIGDSLTEGYGVAKTEAYPALLEKDINENSTYKIKVINAGVSGSTTASGIERLNWQLKSKPRIVLIALGANDGLRGIPVETSKKNLEKIIEASQAKNLEIIFGGMFLPQNYGEKYRQDFQKMFSDIAKKYNLIFIPFLLDGVAKVKELNIDDGIHPNANGHKIIAKTVRPYLLEALKKVNQ